MKNYTILSPFKDADGLHKPGDKDISLSDADSKELVEIGAIAESAATAGSVVPTDPAERQAAIVAAIYKLDPNNADLWLRDGRPDASAIVEILGWNITATERNEAWTSMQPA